MSVTVKLSGFKELEQQLDRLSKSAGKAVLRRALIKSAHPMAELAFNMAPDDPETNGNDLRASIGVGTKLSTRQAKLHRKMFRNDKAAVEVFVGAGNLPHAHLQEFGTFKMGPQPFMRPAWDQDKHALLDRLSDELWAELSKAIRRADAKAARQAGG